MNLVYQDFEEATRYLKEWIEKGGKQVDNTLEVTNVAYTIFTPLLTHLNPHQPWADIEFEDRVSLWAPQNPGRAWKELPEVWEPMMEEHPLFGGATLKNFSYTYSERMAYQLHDVLQELKRSHSTREAYLAIWNPALDPFRLSRRRVPCTLGYQFLIRRGLLHLTYLQRSCNFLKHYQDDVYLAHRLQLWVADKLELQCGEFSHWIGSLHIFTQGGAK